MAQLDAHMVPLATRLPVQRPSGYLHDFQSNQNVPQFLTRLHPRRHVAAHWAHSRTILEQPARTNVHVRTWGVSGIGKINVSHVNQSLYAMSGQNVRTSGPHFSPPNAGSDVRNHVRSVSGHVRRTRNDDIYAHRHRHQAPQRKPGADVCARGVETHNHRRRRQTLTAAKPLQRQPRRMR